MEHAGKTGRRILRDLWHGGNTKIVSSHIARRRNATIQASNLAEATETTLVEGFEHQSAKRFSDALQAYRQSQRSRSPFSQVFGANAEALLLLRVPVDLAASGSDALADSKPSPGDVVSAPWIEDGGEYSGTVVSVDTRAGHCTVDWADGGTTHRIVPLASIANLHGGLYPCVMSERQNEVRAWAVRRSLRHALQAWEMQAEFGTSHDAFVDFAGILCDAAMAEIRAALSAPNAHWLAESLGNARRHLQRARFTVERAYAPDARALGAICAHRAELLRITVAVAASVGKDSKLVDASGAAESLQEALRLHERAAFHVAAAKWQTSDAVAGWKNPAGHFMPNILQELLWAKTLASFAILPRSKAKRRPTSHSKKAIALQQPRRMLIANRSNSWSLPEKLVPLVTEAPQSYREPEKLGSKSKLQKVCPARAAVTRAWRVLCLAAGKPVASVRNASSEEAKKLALSVQSHSSGSRLLLEVATLIFAMGCHLGRSGWARRVATPLVATAVERLELTESGGILVDDALYAARLAVEIITRRRSNFHVPEDNEKSGLPDRRHQLHRREAILSKSPDAQAPEEVRGSQHCRWRLVGYDATQELWTFRIGSHRVAYLASCPPLTWCLEGLALSEAAPLLASSTEE